MSLSSAPLSHRDSLSTLNIRSTTVLKLPILHSHFFLPLLTPHNHSSSNNNISNSSIRMATATPPVIEHILAQIPLPIATTKDLNNSQQQSLCIIQFMFICYIFIPTFTTKELKKDISERFNFKDHSLFKIAYQSSLITFTYNGADGGLYMGRAVE